MGRLKFPKFPIHLYTYIYRILVIITVVISLICIWTIDVSIFTDEYNNVYITQFLTNGFIHVGTSKMYHISLYILLVCIIILGILANSRTFPNPPKFPTHK